MPAFPTQGRPADVPKGYDPGLFKSKEWEALNDIHRSLSEGRPELKEHGVILQGMPGGPGNVGAVRKMLSDTYSQDILAAMAKKAPMAGEAFLDRYAPNIGKLLRPWRATAGKEGIKDLEQEAKIAALGAFDKWNKTDKSIPFHAFMMPHVKMAISKYIREQGKDISLSKGLQRDIGVVRKAENKFPYEAGPDYAKGAPVEKVPSPGPLELSLLTKLKPSRIERVQRKLYPTEGVPVNPFTGGIPSSGATIVKRGPTDAAKQVTPEQLVSKPASSIAGETEDFIKSLKVSPVIQEAFMRHLKGQSMRDIAKEMGGSHPLAQQRINQAIKEARKAFTKMEGMK